MDKAKRKAIEAAGMQFTTVAEFLGLTPEEEAFIELRVAVSMAARRARIRRKLTQAQVARRINSTEPLVVKAEAGASDVSLDLMFRSLFAAGGTLADLLPKRSPRRARPAAKAKPVASREAAKDKK